MKTPNLKTIRTLILISGMLPLTGCVTNLKPIDLSMSDQVDAQPPGKISIDQLLLNARQQSSSSSVNSDLYLQFEGDRHQLNPEEKQQILSFSRKYPETLYLACAPASGPDQFTAATIGVRRCQQISQFLRERSFSSEIMLSPQLLPDQVRLYRSDAAGG